MARNNTTPPSSANPEDDWAPYPDFPHIELNQYTGQVRNTETGNLIGSSKGKRPFFTVSVKCANGKTVKHTQNLARAMLLTFRGHAPTRGHEASHLNHDPSDCRLVNLVWETRAANLSRRVAPPDGAQHHHAKLGLVDAYRIYWLYHSGALSMGKLATRYRVTKSTIQQLVTGKTWRSYQDHFASLFAQGAETYSDSSAPSDLDDDSDAAQPPNPFLEAAAEIAQFADEDVLIPAASISEATTKRPRPRRF